MNGSFYEYTKNITRDSELFDIIAQNFDSFKDERSYEGKTVYFYKLAQLLVSDILHIRKHLENIEVDYSNLVGCADYKIPQVLRALNFICYDEELSNIVDSKVEIDISSEYEVEIRASQIVIIDYIKSKLKDIDMIEINDYFFSYSKKISENLKPYHLCRNVNY